MTNELLEKVEELCQRIDSYTEKEISVKNQVKTDTYVTRIKKLISMIENAENDPNIPKVNNEEEANRTIHILKEDKYNPYSKDFYYRERLDKLDGNIDKLIEELKAEDEVGYRNAYIIKEIERNIDIANGNIKNKVSLWEKLKSIFK